MSRVRISRLLQLAALLTAWSCSINAEPLPPQQDIDAAEEQVLTASAPEPAAKPDAVAQSDAAGDRDLPVTAAEQHPESAEDPDQHAEAAPVTENQAEVDTDRTGNRQRQQAEQRYLDAVYGIEAEGGAYDPSLTQHLVALGLNYQEDGRHAEAVLLLGRAAHITRVNEGLYNAAHIPILEELIESYAALGEWEEVNSRYHQVFQIHNRNSGGDDERMLPALRKLSAWHLRAYLDDIGENPLNHLYTARNLYDSTIGIMQARYGPMDPRLAEPLRHRTLVDYYIASYAPPAQSGFSATTRAWDEPTTPGYVLNSFSAGREALARVVELQQQDASGNELNRSQALAEMGDWHQLFNRRQSALRFYLQAHEVAAQAGDQSAEMLQTVFGTPRALPLIPDTLQVLQSAEAPMPQEAHIKVRFNVTEQGRADAIQIVEQSDPQEQKFANRLRKRLIATRFRPRFEAGQPVATDNVVYRYTYTP